jgi:hypothetical protein
MHLSDEEWEEFIEEACVERPLRPNGTQRYLQVKRLGSAGDAGRDVEARLSQPLTEGQWDLFQGKHYNHRLAPGDALPELAKFFFNLAQGVFPAPRTYYFCSPQNAGPDLHDLIANPTNLKGRLLKDWAVGATGLKNWKGQLTPKIKDLVISFDFSIFQECLVRDLLSWHANNRKKHFELFRIEAERGDDPAMPALPASEEMEYVTELLRVYTEDKGHIVALGDLGSDLAYQDHFHASRSTFYCAEGLKRFSRDLYTEDEFGNLLSMLHSGLKPIIHNPKLKTGMDRVTRATEAASTLPVSDSKLSPRLRSGDLPGACHHLVNERKLKWVK